MVTRSTFAFIGFVLGLVASKTIDANPSWLFILGTSIGALGLVIFDVLIWLDDKRKAARDIEQAEADVRAYFAWLRAIEEDHSIIYDDSRWGGGAA